MPGASARSSIREFDQWGVRCSTTCEAKKRALAMSKIKQSRYILLMEFDWDPNKAASNLRRHSVPFSEAATVFSDPLSTTVPDPDHSLDEDHSITVGLSIVAAY